MTGRKSAFRCELPEQTRITRPTLSRHMKSRKAAAWSRQKKKGKRSHYFLNGEPRAAFRDCIELIRNGSIRVRFNTLEERQRAFRILEERGFVISDRIKDPAAFEPQGIPGATNVLSINLQRK